MATLINVSDIVEDNGKPWWFNNAQITHSIPLGTKVKHEEGEWYVVGHSRDCDMTPLYSISKYWEDARYYPTCMSDFVKVMRSKERLGDFTSIDEYSEYSDKFEGRLEFYLSEECLEVM